MDLLEVVTRTPVPEPWSEGEKIPWDDLAFSRRMLAEHVTDAHDRASRRPAIIDAETTDVTRYAQSMQAYTDAEYETLLADTGFTLIRTYPGLGDIVNDDFYVLLAVAA